MTTRVRVQLLAHEHGCSISAGSCLTTLSSLISRRATTICVATRSTGWDRSASTITRSCWKVSKHDWAHRLQNSFTRVYKNLFHDTKIASIPALTMLRSNLSMYVYFICNKIFCLIAYSVNSSPEVTFVVALVFSITFNFKCVLNILF
jgi:hypothetical protein